MLQKAPVLSPTLFTLVNTMYTKKSSSPLYNIPIFSAINKIHTKHVSREKTGGTVFLSHRHKVEYKIILSTKTIHKGGK